MRLPNRFLADQTPRDASLWRFPVSLVTGLAAAALVIIVGAILLLTVTALLTGSGLISRPELKALGARMLNDATLPTDLLGTVLMLSYVALTLCAVAVTFVLVSSAIYRRRFMSYLTSASRFRWRLVLLGAGLLFLALGPLTALTRDFGEPEPLGPMPILLISQTLGGRLLYVLAAAVMLLAAAAAEEILFRGWLLRHLAAVVRNPWLGALIGSVIFSAIHLDPNMDGFIARIVMGLGFCYATLRFGGIEFALGLHVANNLIITILVEPLTVEIKTHPFTWEFVPALAVIMVAYVGLTELAARWKSLARWAGAEIEPPKAEAFS